MPACAIAIAGPGNALGAPFAQDDNAGWGGGGVHFYASLPSPVPNGLGPGAPGVCGFPLIAAESAAMNGARRIVRMGLRKKRPQVLRLPSVAQDDNFGRGSITARLKSCPDTRPLMQPVLALHLTTRIAATRGRLCPGLSFCGRGGCARGPVTRRRGLCCCGPLRSF